MAAENTKQLNTEPVDEYEALIDEISAKYDISTPEGFKQFKAELAATMRMKQEVSQGIMDAQATTITKQEEILAQYKQENKDLKSLNRDTLCQLKYLAHYKEKAADLQKKLWEAQQVNDALSKLISDLESNKITGKAEQKLKAQVLELMNRLDKAEKDINELKHDYELLSRVNGDIVDYADAEMSKLKKECDHKIAVMSEDLRKVRQEAYALSNKVAALEADNKAKDKELDHLKKKGQVTYINSSNPSSSYKFLPIVNTREPSEKKRGGQENHPYHPRKKMEPTNIIVIPTPEELLDTTKYRPTGETVARQNIKASIIIEVDEYVAATFIEKSTGKTCHAPFPEEVPNDVNYDATVKAIVYMLNNGCNVSIGKVQDFIYMFSDHKLRPSTGFISELCNEFTLKTEKEREGILKELSTSRFLNIDFTYGRLDGKQGTVLIMTNGEKTSMTARPKRGQAAVDGTILPTYEGTVVSDNESVLKKLGGSHQQCLAHVIRYLKKNELFEPNFKWSPRMLQWVYDAIECWQEARSNNSMPDEEEVKALETEYDEIIQVAAQEYKDFDPSALYREGFNLYTRMAEHKEEYTLFLHNPEIPPTNNAAEIMARKFKRKAKQVMTFRSFEGMSNYLCGETVMESMKAEGKDVKQGLVSIFSTPLQPGQKKRRKAQQAENTENAENATTIQDGAISCEVDSTCPECPTDE